jgi:hypothetical protein
MATDLFQMIRYATALDIAGRPLRQLDKLQDAKQAGAHPRFVQRLEKLCEPERHRDSLLIDEE